MRRPPGEGTARWLNGLRLLSVAPNPSLKYGPTHYLRYNTARMGGAMLARIVTRKGYRPEQLRPIAGSVVDALHIETLAPGS